MRLNFFVAAELCRRGLVAVVTLGNCPNTDILCSDVEGTKFAHIQVKTFVPGSRTCAVGLKAEKKYHKSFFWILAGIPSVDSADDFVYYVIPAADMAKNISESHAQWLNAAGRNGKKRNQTDMRAVSLPPSKNPNGWDVSKYKKRWDLIQDKLCL